MEATLTNDETESVETFLENHIDHINMVRVTPRLLRWLGCNSAIPKCHINGAQLGDDADILFAKIYTVLAAKSGKLTKQVFEFLREEK